MDIIQIYREYTGVPGQTRVAVETDEGLFLIGNTGASQCGMAGDGVNNRAYGRGDVREALAAAGPNVPCTHNGYGSSRENCKAVADAIRKAQK